MTLPTSTDPLLTDGQPTSQHQTSQWGHITFVVLVVAAYATIFLEAWLGETRLWFAPWQIALMLGAGAVYSGLMLKEEAIFHNFSANWVRVLYFVGQFGLVLVLGLAAEAQGQWWLMALPVLGSAAERGRRWMVGAGAGALLVISLGYVITTRSLELLLLVPLFSLPAIVFVLVFARIAFRERQGRLQIEQLAGELRLANHKLSEYALKVEELATIQERNRMAREIHDTLGHYLTVVNVQIRAARAIMSQHPAQAAEALHKAQSLTHEGLSEVRQSVAALRSGEMQPLPDLLRELVAASQEAGLPTRFQLLGRPRPLAGAHVRALYRAAQEGLTNIRKHANANVAEVTLDYTAAEVVRLLIADDGRGAEQTTGGFGLLGMRERLQLLGGEVAIHTAVGQGFRLQLVVPTP